MNEKEFNDFIHFSDQKEYIKNQLEKEEWIIAYQSKKQKKMDALMIFVFTLVWSQKERKRIIRRIPVG